MVGQYGSEINQGNKYRLSFTVGGLLLSQGRVLASMFMDFLGDDFPDSPNDRRREVGKEIVSVRRQAIADNVLAYNAESTGKRVVSETLKRLSALTYAELSYLAGDESTYSERQALMWVGMCRYYAFVGDFAREVVREHFLGREYSVSRADYDSFVSQKALWHPELGNLTEKTAGKLRSCLFQALREADFLDSSSDLMKPTYLGQRLLVLFVSRPESVEFFPAAVPDFPGLAGSES